MNEVVNNTDLLQIDVLVFTVWPFLNRLFIVAVEWQGSLETTHKHCKQENEVMRLIALITDIKTGVYEK